MRVLIETVSHGYQRYDTCGDWYLDPETGTMHIKVSRLGNWKEELLVAVHELIEASLCEARGISEEEVTRFDMAYKGNEPGNSIRAPYHKEHVFATQVEKRLARQLGVEWEQYENHLDNLTYNKEAT